MTDGTGAQGTIEIPKPIAGKIIIKPFRIETNKSVKFVNQTESTVSIWIPKGDSLFVPPDGTSILKVPVGAGGLVLTVKQPPTNGRYPYSVYCGAIDNFGEGNSAPVIICP